MRFVAGRGAVYEMLRPGRRRGDADGRGGVSGMLLAGALLRRCLWPRRRAEMLRPGRRGEDAGGADADWPGRRGGDADGRGAVAEVLLTEAPLQTGQVRRHEPQCL